MMMGYSNAVNPETFALSDLQRLVFDFESLAEKKAALIPPGSKFEAASLALMEMLETYTRKVPHDTKRDYRDDWRRALSLGEILRKAIILQPCPMFDKVWPHLLLLLSGGEIGQNLWSPKEDQNTDKVFELYVALMILPICAGIELDDPVKSSGGKNPDILAEIYGASWACACKAMHTRSSITLLERVREGIDQIKATNANRGLVVVSPQNVVPHDQFWPATKDPITGDYKYHTYQDLSEVEQRLQVEFNRHQTESLDPLQGPDGFRQLFAGTRVCPSILAHASTVIGVLKDGGPKLHLIRALCSIQIERPQLEDEVIFEWMNLMLHESYLDLTGLEARIASM
jgi:hypothetical protein